MPAKGVRLGVYGLLGSTSWWWNTRSNPAALLEIPSFFSLDALVSYDFNGRYQIFMRLGNIFNHYYYTEPGFPWRGRYFEAGFRIDAIK
jgi:iron complex outermembrane receptor protein